MPATRATQAAAEEIVPTICHMRLRAGWGDGMVWAIRRATTATPITALNSSKRVSAATEGCITKFFNASSSSSEVKASKYFLVSMRASSGECMVK